MVAEGVHSLDSLSIHDVGSNFDLYNGLVGPDGMVAVRGTGHAGRRASRRHNGWVRR